MTIPSPAQPGPISVYAAEGAVITNYALNIESGALDPRKSITLPSRVQYAWPHPSLPILYAACADRGAGDAQPYYLCALLRDDAGDLSLFGDVIPMPERPIHVTTDNAGRHILTAYGEAPGLSVHTLKEDGSIGEEVPRSEPFDFGFKPHHVRVVPGDDYAILVARGAKGFGKPSYIEGAFKLVRFNRGSVETFASIAPDSAHKPQGFNPRNVEFHPNLPLVFASLEAQNELSIYPLEAGGIGSVPASTLTTLENPQHVFKRQDGGEVHVHPGGGYVYVANRNDGYAGGHDGPSWLNPDPIPVFPGGENNIAVFSLDASGMPTLIQHESTRGLQPKTIALDASGRILIAANIAPTIIAEHDQLRTVPAGLSVFSIGADGRLTFRHTLEFALGPEKILWMGIVG